MTKHNTQPDKPAFKTLDFLQLEFRALKSAYVNRTPRDSYAMAETLDRVWQCIAVIDAHYPPLLIPLKQDLLQLARQLRSECDAICMSSESELDTK